MTSPHRKNSKGFWSTLDLILVFLILTSMLLPLLPYSVWAIHRRAEWAADQQRLSLTIQYAHHLYASTAVFSDSEFSAYQNAKAVPLDSDPLRNFTQPGHYGALRGATAQLQLTQPLAAAGLSGDVQAGSGFLPPPHDSQTCIRRLMLGESGEPYPLRLCVWPS